MPSGCVKSRPSDSWAHWPHMNSPLASTAPRIRRRKFLGTALAAGVGNSTLAHAAGAAPAEPGPPRGMPVVISSGNGLRATEKAMERLRSGADTLDAVIAGVNIVEEDPA